MSDETFAWFVGVDWGSEKHHVCILDQQGTIICERNFPHGGAGLAELGDWLLSIAGAANAVAVAIEVPHGPVVDSLIDRGFVVHAINPKQLDRLRDRFSIAGAKDDRRDGYVLADGVRTDRRFFRRLQVADPRIVELRAWSRLAEELQEERVRLSNRVGHELWRYYPQLQKLTDDLAAPWFLELWTIAPTPANASADDRRNMPTERMKSDVVQTIPLSTAAVALLDRIKRVHIAPDMLILGSRRRGGSGRRTDAAMQTLLRKKIGFRNTVHALRPSFPDWVAEVHPQRMLEPNERLTTRSATRFRGPI